MYKLKKPDLARLKAGCDNVVKKVGKRNLVIVLTALLIGGAVYLNWRLFLRNDRPAGNTYYSAGETGAGGDAQKTGKEDGNPDADAEKGGSDYFAATQINRQRSRDEALEVLRMIVDNEEALQESKDAALKEISQISADIAKEANIEAMVKAKGFESCVAVIGSGNCSVIVKTAGLMPNQLAQIQEIVYKETGILPANVTIVEKKG